MKLHGALHQELSHALQLPSLQNHEPNQLYKLLSLWHSVIATENRIRQERWNGARRCGCQFNRFDMSFPLSTSLHPQHDLQPSSVHWVTHPTPMCLKVPFSTLPLQHTGIDRDIPWGSNPQMSPKFFLPLSFFPFFFSFFFSVVGLELRAYTLSHSTSPVFLWRVFQDRSLQLFAWGWLWTVIFLISASWIGRIIGMSHWYQAFLPISDGFSRGYDYEMLDQDGKPPLFFLG
jgi:hypothetical protein